MAERKRLTDKKKGPKLKLKLEVQEEDASERTAAELPYELRKLVGAEGVYTSDFARTAEILCSHGATDAELAVAFNVSTSTIKVWKSKHPEFGEAVRKGKAEVFDPKVERALAERALGYSFDTEEIKVIDGVVVRVPVRKHVPPDTAACIFWLKNRNPKQWRDVVTHEGTLDLSKLSAAELLAEIQQEAAQLGLLNALPTGLAPRGGKPGNGKLN